MSDSSNESKSPILSAIGTVFIFLVPAALIVMLGFVGVAFIGGSGPDVAQEDTETAPEVAAASSEGDSASADAASAPAEGGEKAAQSAAKGEKAAPAAGGIDPDVMALGKTSYATCAACHGPDGQGLKAGPMLMAPTLTGSELLLGDPDKSLLILLKGIAKENMDYMGVMASLGAALDDEKMAAVLTYTRNAFGNSAPPVTPEQAAAAREKFADVEAPAGVKRSAIDEIVEAHE